MIKILLIVTTTAGLLAVTDDWIRAKYHPPEQQLTYSDSVNKQDRLVVNRPHLDLWVTERKAVLWYCVVGPCRADRAAGDLRD